ncbi:MAG: cysteine desulfurase [Candidatus Hinthialibacter antarcticus]|nr:cysteine desulfurase [Candidatus Hinthialibacter antarcticus]
MCCALNAVYQSNSVLDPNAVFDVERIREDFPILRQQVHGKPLAYLDNAASAQKPQVVIDAMNEVMTSYYSNIHRGVHKLSELSTRGHDEARVKVSAFLNAPDEKQVIFVRNATEGINLVARTWADANLKPGDEILITHMEHHSNIVPWQMACERTGATLKVVPVLDNGELDLDGFDSLLNEKTKLVGVVHVSNALGTINPVEEIIKRAHQQGALVLVDGAQSTPHMRVDVQAMDCDFFVFSGHKVYGPSGVGALYGKREHLEAMPPLFGGGDMITSVSFEKTVYNEIPYKFEAGTPDIIGAIGLGAAIDYLESVGLDAIAAYENELLEYGTAKLADIADVKMIGTAPQKAAILNFVLDCAHPHDIGTILDQDGIAVRTGHHCTEPLMKRFNVPATARASMSFYNTKEEIDRLADGIRKVVRLFR